MTTAELFRAAPAGPLIPVDIGHDRYAAVTDPRTAFWALVDKMRVTESIADDTALMREFRDKADDFARELHALRRHLGGHRAEASPEALPCGVGPADALLRRGERPPQDGTDSPSSQACQAGCSRRT